MEGGGQPRGVWGGVTPQALSPRFHPPPARRVLRTLRPDPPPQGEGGRSRLWTAATIKSALPTLRPTPYMPNPLAGISGTQSILAPHALHAAVSRRAPRPASRLRGRRQAREAAQAGQGVQGAVAVPAGEDAVLHRQRQ